MTLLAALTVVLMSVAASLLGLALILRTPFEAIPVGYRPVELLPFVILQLAFTGVGALLVWRRPENPIGRLLCGTAVVSAVLFLLAGQTVHAISTGDVATAATAAWLGAWLMNGLAVTQIPVLVMFPDGRVTSRAARVSLGLLAVTVALTTLVVALRPGPLTNFPDIANPYPLRHQGGALDALFVAGLAAAAIATPLALWSQISRFRRSSGIEHQQFKWFIASMVVLSLSMIPALIWLYEGSDATSAGAQRYAGRALAALASTTVPVAIGIAILRYRLYDIDFLINRTLVYGAVSAALITTYLAGVVVLQTLMRPFTSGSELAVAGSTLLVVVLFQPLRRRAQDAVDRRFYRARYDAARTLDAFGARLRDEVDLDSVRADLLDAVRDTVRPAHASVWLRERR